MNLNKSAIGFVFALVAVTAARADIINGGFETGNLTGWTSSGYTRVVTSSFGTGPISGTYQALVEGGAAASGIPTLETFLHVPGGSLDALGNGVTHAGSAIEQSFMASAGQKLTFAWNFITDEQPPSIFNDFAFFALNSSVNTLDYANNPSLIPFGSLLQSGFAQESITIPTTGTYTLSLGVANVSDASGLPQLLVDNVSLSAPVPEPASGLLFLLAVTLLLLIRPLLRHADDQARVAPIPSR